MKYLILFSFITILLPFELFAANAQKSWGVGMQYRHAQSPYANVDEPLSTMMPVMYYQGEYVFMRGMEGGIHLYQHQDWEFNAITRMRFIDIPAQYMEEDAKTYHFDSGIQVRKTFNHNNTDLEIMSDRDGNMFSNITSAWQYSFDDWLLMPSVNAQYKSANFNNEYFSVYPVTKERISGGIQVSAKLETRYQVTSNLYLLGSFASTRLDNQAYKSQIIDSQWNNEVYFGFGFFSDHDKPLKDKISTKSYLRVAHGWATPSNIGDIFTGGSESDEYNNQMTSLFYGVPLSDEAFGVPIDIYLTPGFIWHWNSEVQDSEQEVVLAFKAYYTVNWPARWRIGLAEGLSYVSNLTYIEQKEMDEKGYKGSEMLNYLDFSLDINLGDVFNSPAMNNTWLGYSLHHRSAIFEKSSQFGNIKGGSNYNTVYLQFDF